MTLAGIILAMFITFEGPEGSGKSTLVSALAARLAKEGVDVLTTREPGSGEVGKSIRDLLLSGGDLDDRCELFLFLADRAQHVATLIRPALEQGQTVLCDRFTDSTVVYQGYGRGLDLPYLRQMNTFATDHLVPQITFLLDIDPAVGLSRITEKDRLDDESLAFHERVRAGFLTEAKFDSRWRVIDASQSPGQVLDECWDELKASRQTVG